MNFEQDDNRLLQCSKFGGTVVLATDQRAPLIKSAPRLRCTVAKGEPPECDLRREGDRRGDDGAWGRIRTTDTRIFNPLLYQLSYPGEGRRRGSRVYKRADSGSPAAA